MGAGLKAPSAMYLAFHSADLSLQIVIDLIGVSGSCQQSEKRYLLRASFDC